MSNTDTTRFSEIEENFDIDIDAFAAYCDNQHITEDDADEATVADFNDAYIGEFESDEEFAEHWADELESLQIDGTIRPHIDWSSVWYCELRHDYYSVNDQYFFRNI